VGHDCGRTWTIGEIHSRSEASGAKADGKQGWEEPWRLHRYTARCGSTARTSIDTLSPVENLPIRCDGYIGLSLQLFAFAFQRPWNPESPDSMMIGDVFQHSWICAHATIQGFSQALQKQHRDEMGSTIHVIFSDLTLRAALDYFPHLILELDVTGMSRKSGVLKRSRGDSMIGDYVSKQDNAHSSILSPNASLKYYKHRLRRFIPFFLTVTPLNR
jgi:hypothetical protein